MIPTVKIKATHPDAIEPYVIINESDFDETVHELFEADEAPKKSKGKKAE